MNRIFLLTLACAGLASGAAPAWDSSGDGLLTGTYNFRQVMYISDGSGNVNHEFAYFGNISFDGKGGYTLSGSNTLNNTGGTLAIPATGTYSVATSGYGFLSDPLAAGQSVYFLVSNGILLGSATENPGANSAYNNDLFIATPATPTFTNASFKGAYSITRFLPGGDVLFTMNPDGAGHIATVGNSGYTIDGNFGGASYNVTYAVSGGAVTVNNGGTFGVGDVGGIYLVSPEFETLYMSPDTNFIFGGSPTGYDMFIGVRTTSGTTALTSGLYYEIGLDEDASQYRSNATARIDSYYGVFNALAIVEEDPATGAIINGGTAIGHERLLYAGSSAEGVTYTTTYPTGSYTGPANIGQLDPSATAQYTVGTGGIRIGLGIGPWLGIEVALPAPAPTPSGSVYIDPTGIVNTASSAPFTAGISPGEFVSLYNGVNTGSSTSCATGAPFPAILSGIQVLVNGVAAPIYCVGSGNTPVTFIVPDSVGQNPVATIQVMNGSTLSNTVTTFVYKTTPGVLTFDPVGGTGFAAAEHADYSVITPANPAKPGETIAVYLTGLGSPVPASGIAADVAGIGSPSIPYAGQTTDPGLYQINFQVPATAPNGNDALAIAGPDSWSSESLLPVAGQTQSPNGTNPKWN